MSPNLSLNAWTTVLPLRTPTLPPATSTNTMVVGAGRFVVIEPATPHPEERERLVAEIEARRGEGGVLDGILLTHHHVDHIGFADGLRARYGVPLMAHEATASRVDFSVDAMLTEGQVLELGDGVEIECVWTPGHAPGHLVYVERKGRVAHGGDLVAGEGTILVDPDDAGDMVEYLDSLRRLATLEIDRLVPAHGPVLEDPAGIANHYIAHRLKREDKVLAAIGPIARTVDDVLADAYADTPKFLWGLAAKSLEAHLRKLDVEGRIARSGDTVSSV